MSERARGLLAIADAQIGELIGVLSSAGDVGLLRACPGREKLGDGTVGATALHVAGRYRMIAAFVCAPAEVSDGSMHHELDRRSADLGDVLELLAAAQLAFSRLADVTDERLDEIPPTGSFRFCDGQRTLDQVVAGLLKHQAHQVDAVRAALDAV